MALPINYAICFHIQALFVVHDKMIFVTLGCRYVLITIGDKTPNTILHECWKLGCSLAKHCFALVLVPMNVFSNICGCKNIPMSVGHTNAAMVFHDCGIFGSCMV